MQKFNPDIFLKTLILFIASHAVGLFVANHLIGDPSVIQPEPVNTFTFIDILVIIVAAAVFILIVIKFKRAGGWFFRVMLTLLVLGGMHTFLDIWLQTYHAFFIAIAAAVIFLIYNNVIIHNVVMVITFGGIGALLGLSFTPQIVVIILVVLSFYDIIAVYKTKHMVSMAHNMIKARAIFGFIVPEKGQKLTTPIRNIQPGKGFMILGSGDVVLPLLLAVSLIPVSLTDGIIVSIASFVGLLFMQWLFTRQPERRPMAALPPIALMAILGYLVALL
ncbi:MAG: presenilin family intramembrane aspartyl protease [Parcubacteria group bacterium]